MAEKWECQVCGYICEFKPGTPGGQSWKCPGCGIGQAFFLSLTTGHENKQERQEPD